MDGVPLFGSPWLNYLLLSALTAAAMWVLMGLSPNTWLELWLSSKNYFNLILALAIGMNTIVVFGSTTSGGLMVEAGQRFGVSGRLTVCFNFYHAANAMLVFEMGNCTASRHCITSSTSSRWYI